MIPFGIGFYEIVLIFIVLIIFVGPDGIPQAVRKIAKVIKTIRGFIDEIRYSPEFDEVKREILDPIQEARRFNPKARAREWVQREIESPINETMTEVMNETIDKPMKSTKQESTKQESTSDQSHDQDRHMVHDDETHKIDHNESHNSDDRIDDGIDEEIDDDIDDELISRVSTIDPLERGIPSINPLDQSKSDQPESDQPESDQPESDQLEADQLEAGQPESDQLN